MVRTSGNQSSSSSKELLELEPALAGRHARKSKWLAMAKKPAAGKQAPAKAAAGCVVSMCVHVLPEEYSPKMAAAAATVSINQDHPAGSRYRMPPLMVGGAGGKQNGQRTMLYNLGRVCSALQRSPELLGCYFSQALSMPVRRANPSVGIHAYVLGGPAAPEQLDKLLHGFISEWVLCPNCRLPESGLSVLADGPVGTAGGEGGRVGESGAAKSNKPKGGTGNQRKGKQRKDKDKGGGGREQARAVWSTCSACSDHSRVAGAIAVRQPKLVKLLLARPLELCQWGAVNRPLAYGATGRRLGEAQALAESTGGGEVIMQLRTAGAFASHCRQLGRLMAIDVRADSRSGAVQLPVDAELLVKVLALLDPESIYRCMQTSVGWHCQGVLAMDDQRLLRHSTAAAGQGCGGDEDGRSESSSDQSSVTSDSSSGSGDEDGDVWRRQRS